MNGKHSEKLFDITIPIEADLQIFIDQIGKKQFWGAIDAAESKVYNRDELDRVVKIMKEKLYNLELTLGYRKPPKIVYED